MTDFTPSPRELDILKILWESGPASVRKVHGRLCPRGECAFNTVQTMLRIMEDKGLVDHRVDGRTFVYRATYTRRKVASRFVRKVFDGAVDQLVISMLQSEKIDPEKLKQLEEIISQARRDARSRKRAAKKAEES